VHRLYKNALRTFCLAVAATVGCSLFLPAVSTAASAPSLHAVSTADKTATVSIPSGWTLAKGSNGFVYVHGPNDERLSLGVLVVVKNASGGSVGANVAFAMPFSANLKDKLTQIIQTGARQQGTAVPQITYAGQTQTRLPMCALFLGGWNAGGDSRKFEAVICSLRPDYLGLYKNLVFLAQVPASMATQERSLVQQIVSSYRVTPTMFRKMLSPYTPLPPHPPAGSMPALAPYQDPTNSDCFDYNVIREDPPWQVPMHCGGTQPG
jgi:hypothetical protein